MEFIIALMTTLIAIPFLKPIADKVGLVDVPNARKQHDGAVPLIGGIAIFLGTLTACMIAFPDDSTIRLFLISAALIVFLGVMDDYHDLPVGLRLVSQLLIGSILVYGAGNYLDNLGDLFAVGEITLGVLGTIFTMVAVLAAINAFNMTDGIDGLAGSLAINTFLSIATLFYLQGQHQNAALPVIVAFSVIPFLLFNLSLLPGKARKIFMGDAGSMFIGLSVIWMLTLGTQGEQPAFRPVTALWIIAIPLMDMAAIMYRRINKGQSPFQPDRDHLHHIFIRAGIQPRSALIYISLASALLSGIGLTGEYYQVPEWIMFTGFLCLFVAYSFVIMHIWKAIRFVKKIKRAKRLKKYRRI
ncbi:UDP-N-acetylglucosamine--undecaprenyl-phosphate N-acetylglucosaminephosphotransferase [Catenovulum sp. SM1970]|uniref:UDP-N-acetylglucosamine--undecaprenyl-phosphate N-acetylglucosaminephosphotransferase n=1 Tax=Marinifaba aquimaris TaxID=2741323 RepID=UPI00157377D4|nr:UDP-N-acetylglucosamine--undecaprenyl-phosphate N-acetylglucosaminephosphotransferase [Marinifaba aquimaris]NTS76891.1 UDP-N-acetylglucosamine--undecaprenyl-phosphate N-acetylglucosaminephosphotransferase [Marinifaba aquimaris]